MKIMYNESLVKEALYSEQYCDICGNFKYSVELKLQDCEGKISYTTICKDCLKKLLKDFDKSEPIQVMEKNFYISFKRKDGIIFKFWKFSLYRITFDDPFGDEFIWLIN